MKQWLKEFIHNCIVHPLMMVLPSDKATRLHDINANFTFGLENRYDELFLETGEVSDETIKQKFIEASKKYLLEKDQESIQKVINKLASKLNKKSIDHILNKDCNGILFNFDSNELYLIEDCDDLLEDS